MTVSKMEQVVLQKAEAEAKEILAKARKEADERWETRSARLREEHERRVEAARQEIESELERTEGARANENRLELLRLKNEIIEEIFDKALDRFVESDAYPEWLKQQIKSLPKMGGAELVANKADRDRLKKASADVERDDMPVAEDAAPIRGGFLVRGKQVDMDVSVESLMDAMRESLTQQIARKLFDEEAE